MLLEVGGTAEEQLEGWDTALRGAQQEYELVVEEGYEDANNRALLYEILFDAEWGYFANEFMVKNGWRVLAVEQEFNLLYNETNRQSLPIRCRHDYGRQRREDRSHRPQVCVRLLHSRTDRSATADSQVHRRVACDELPSGIWCIQYATHKKTENTCSRFNAATL